MSSVYARRRRRSTPHRAGVHQYDWREGISRLFNRRAAHCQMVGSVQDFLDLFVPPELHEAWLPVSQAALHRAPGTMVLPLNLRLGSMEVEVVMRDRVLMPFAIAVQPTNQALVERVTQWGNERLELGIEFGRVAKVIEWLDNACSSPGHVRYLFPSIVSVLAAVCYGKEAPGFEAPITKGAPSITPAIREAIRLASATVAGASLLEDPPTIGEIYPFEMIVPSWATRVHKDPETGWTVTIL